MIRPVTLIALIGIGTALVCLPLAGALRYRAGGWTGSNGWAGWSGWSGPWAGGSGDDGSAEGPSSEIEVRAFAWNGGERLELDVPGKLDFQPAPEWHLSIRGRARTLDQLTVADGHIRFKRRYGGGTVPLDLRLSGPALREVTLNGSGEVVLEGLKQDSLNIAIRGSGSVRAAGMVDRLKINITGSGNALLAPLAVHSATIFIAGSGDANISPSDAATIFIAGSGDVRLHSRPRQLNSRVAGSGHVVVVADDQPSGDQSI